MILRNYGLKEGYTSHDSNASIEEHSGDYWNARRRSMAMSYQWHVYKLAAKLVTRHRLRTVLDVGCGPADKLMKLIAPIAQTTGVDQRTVVELASKGHPRGRFVAVDLDKPDQPAVGVFDLIVCADVIEHMHDPDHVIEFIKRNCGTRSLVLMSTVERDVLRGRDNMKSPMPAHVREWNAAELATYIRAAGFEILDAGRAPAHRTGMSLKLWKRRLAAMRAGVSFRHNQWVLCRLA